VSVGAEQKTVPRVPLSRERVLLSAVELADASGIEAVTMRRLAERLGIEAMSLYHYVANKEQVLDGIVDVITETINDRVERLDGVSASVDWRAAARRRILTAREVFLEHPWAPRVFESRTDSSAQVLRYHDGLIGILRDGGFSYDLIHHALHALGSRALGFSQELFDPAADGGAPDPAMLDAMAGTYPKLVGMLREVAHVDPGSTLGWCDDQTEFEFGLDLLLDGLENIRRRA
jgi:AcrR family transcriptional regulator